ncbi:MAG: AbrB/MazE/SpoVT family DNA-binding domain-containing protein [Candidatus Riflebacteria bacterium]|nr:AbrB/MazE/SpoVT family DNA-binding domain-containing protein [Candidatus Riflebacteria bacterium]
MQSAKLFKNGQSQAVRLPKEYRFSGDEVFIKREGNVILLIPKDRIWEPFLEGLSEFSSDVFDSPRDQECQEREGMFEE